MALNSPAPTPETVSADLSISPFNSRSLVIAVGTIGTQPVQFCVHEAKLAQTAFFEVHEPLPGVQEVDLENEDPRCDLTMPTSGNVAKLEDNSFQRVWKGKVDYHIQDRFFLWPAAFDVFVRYLYREPPTKPTSKKELDVLYRAYGIANMYRCYGLQNKIIDCLRQRYSLSKVAMDDLIWVSNRFGEDLNTPLTAYLIEQVAFEIADNGFQAFATANPFLSTFLEQKDRALRLPLFEALSRHAQRANIDDPATAKRKFHVHEKGDHAGMPKA